MRQWHSTIRTRQFDSELLKTFFHAVNHYAVDCGGLTGNTRGGRGANKDFAENKRGAWDVAQAVRGIVDLVMFMQWGTVVP